MWSLWSVEALPLFSYGFVAIHRCSHFGLSSNSSSFPIDDVLPFLQIYYASQSINQTKSRKLIQFQRSIKHFTFDNQLPHQVKEINSILRINKNTLQNQLTKPSQGNEFNFRKSVKHLKRIKTCWEKAWDKVLSLFIAAASFLCINMAFTSSTEWCLSSQSSAMLLPSLDYKSKNTTNNSNQTHRK